MEGNMVNKDLNFNFSQKRKRRTIWMGRENIFYC